MGQRMTDAPLTVRSDLAGMEAYVSPQRPARYRMNTNESPYPPPTELVASVTEAFQRSSLNRYPDKDATALLDALAAYTGWSRDGIWIANGSNEVFLHFFLAYGGPGRTSLTFEPTYSLHSLIPRITGTRTITLPRAEDFSIDVDAALEVIGTERPEVVITCSPNNPSGNSDPVATIEALLEAAPGVVIIDEAYAEFATSDTSFVSLLERNPRLVITRTFSKAWRLAGVRLGYMLADPSLIEGIAKVRLPYHLSSLSQELGAAAIAHAERALEPVEALRIERERITLGLGSLGLTAFPSDANFVLFKVADADRTWTGLLDKGVLVRNYGSTPGLEGCLRVTAGLPEETDAFLSALEEVLDA
jgi:histidinol-phosphate aminotransferase